MLRSPPGRLRGRLRLHLGLAATVLAAAWSLTAGTASVLAWRAEGATSVASAGLLVSENPTDLEVRNLLRWARRLDPGHPSYDQQLGQHLERLALLMPPRSRDEAALLTLAREHYLDAARQRPTWPMSFIPLLRSAFKLGRLGPEFSRLYRRSCALGRWEPTALHSLVDLGLIVWPLLDGEGQAAVSELLAHGLRLEPRLVLQRAAAFRRGAAVRPLVGSDERLGALYREIVAPAAVAR
jgi:hypothetical protein